jgi:hypothetical protein
VELNSIQRHIGKWCAVEKRAHTVVDEASPRMFPRIPLFERDENV